MELFEPNRSQLSIGYSPDGGDAVENPPRFTWIPAGGDDISYSLEICEDESFTKGIVLKENIPYNFYCPDILLEPGTYYWRYRDMKYKEYSKIRTFTVGAGLPETPVPGREQRYDGTRNKHKHPRLWLSADRAEAFKQELKKNGEYCGFNKFIKNSVEPIINMELPAEPLPYPGNKRDIQIWRKNYMTCQEVLCYIRALSIAGYMLEDNELTEKAKRMLLHVSAWDVTGPTSRSYNDECAFRVAYALAFGYDWLYDRLSSEERNAVLNSLLPRTAEVAEHIITKSRIHYSLYDSHAVRSISSVLVPCCTAMLHEADDAQNWLDYSIEYLSVIYTPWGGVDGGWAEGPAYWTTGMGFVTEALNFIKNYTGIDLYKRPFFQNTGSFMLYCNPPDTYRASFCDQSNLGEPPGIKAAYNVRQFGAVSSKPEYTWYYNRITERGEISPNSFANKGWWDYSYDDLTFAYDYGDLPESMPQDGRIVKWFRDIGWVAINYNMTDFDNHIFLLTKSSPYGSVSHSHGDQNSFVIFAYGEPLIIKSGYYIGFGTSMHLDWRKRSISHNTLLIDGLGQYAGLDKLKQLSATGRVVSVTENENMVQVTEDATEAYRENVPYLKSFIRNIYFIDNEYFIIEDTVELSQSGKVSFLLHSISPFDIQGDTIYIQGEKADLRGEFVYSSSGIENISQTDTFEGVNPDEIIGLAPQHHLKMDTKQAASHRIVTLLYPIHKDKQKFIYITEDNQGFGPSYYFDNNGKTFCLQAAR